MSRYLVVKRFGVSKNLCVPKSCLISTQKKQKGHNKEDQKKGEETQREPPTKKTQKEERGRERKKTRHNV